MHDQVMKIIVWKLELTGSGTDCENMDGIWHVMVLVTMSINTLAFKASLLYHGTDKVSPGVTCSIGKKAGWMD